MGFHPQNTHAACRQAVQNRALRRTRGYDWYTRKERMQSEVEPNPIFPNQLVTQLSLRFQTYSTFKGVEEPEIEAVISWLVDTQIYVFECMKSAF